ncbi:MAG: hypothetical protein IJ643_07920 [Eubacterium sp.]|nr:hypothetical protein [Eubacterium sp.]
MKGSKALPITLASIILAAFLAVSFLMYNASTFVFIAGVKDSYAEQYAKEHKVEFIELYDSDNPDVEIPKIKEEAEKKKENTKKKDKKEEEESVQAEKENAEFSYNYEGKTVNIMMYKGDDYIVIIPDTIDNLPVTKLSMRVLNKGILAVYIPQSVTAIDTEFTTPRYTSTFYSVVAIMVLGYLFALFATFVGMKKAKNAKETFYGIPFVYGGLATFIVITVWCGLSLFFGFSMLLQIIVAIVIFACALGKLLKRSVARELIVEKDEQIKQKTQFIKLLTADADSLVSRAKSDEAKALAKKVYEAIRYSDPMSVPELDDIELQIKNEFTAFSDAVKNDDVDIATTSSEELINLTNDRNNKCRALK